MADTLEIKVGNVPLKPAQQKERRLSVLIWGAPGCYKTTLAATAPGKKLWLSFDPDATAPLGACPDEIVELDYASQPDRVVEEFKNPNEGACRDIDRLLGSDPTIETVVIDSCTSFGDKGWLHGVAKAQGTQKGKAATVEDPGYAGWGNKNAWMRLLVKNMLEITLKHNRHCVVIAHEDKPEKNEQGAIMYITIMLGSSLAQQVPINISEVWHMEIVGANAECRILTRPARLFKPMKTRMFKTTGSPEFKWKFNPETWEGEGLATWYERWKAASYDKIPLPD